MGIVDDLIAEARRREAAEARAVSPLEPEPESDGFVGAPESSRLRRIDRMAGNLATARDAALEGFGTNRIGNIDALPSHSRFDEKGQDLLGRLQIPIPGEDPRQTVPSHAPDILLAQAAMSRERQRRGEEPMPGLFPRRSTVRPEPKAQPSWLPEPEQPIEFESYNRLADEVEAAKASGDPMRIAAARRAAQQFYGQHIEQPGVLAKGARAAATLIDSPLGYPLKGVEALTRASPTPFVAGAAKHVVENPEQAAESLRPGISRWEQIDKEAAEEPFSIGGALRRGMGTLGAIGEMVTGFRKDSGATEAGLASADPLGRFTSSGQQTHTVLEPSKYGMNKRTSWSDVLQGALREGGDPVPGTEILDPSGAHQYEVTKSGQVRPAFEEYEAGPFGSGSAMWGGLALDIATDPWTYLTGGVGAGRNYGLKLGGKEILSAPNAEKIARATGVPQALGWAKKTVSEIPIGRSTGPSTLGDELTRLLDRYWYTGKLKEAPNAQKARELMEWNEGSTRRQNEIFQRQLEQALAKMPLEQQRRVRDAIEAPEAFDWNVVRQEPYSPPRPPGPPGQPQLPPGPAAPAAGVTDIGQPVREPVPPITGEAGPPNVSFGQTASPTAVPGTPDAARYGAIPQHLSGQVPQLTAEEIEAAARIENILGTYAKKGEDLGLVRPRPNYFPRQSARAGGASGQGMSRLNALTGNMKGRQHVDWLNTTIDEVNEKVAGLAKRQGLPVPAPIPHVRDTTAAVNEFWRGPPQDFLEHTGLQGVALPEFYLDDPARLLSGYVRKNTKAFNDADTLKHLRGMTDAEGRPLAEKADTSNRGRPMKWGPTRDVEPDVPAPAGPPVDRTPAPPDAPQLPRGKTGSKREQIVPHFDPLEGRTWTARDMSKGFSPDNPATPGNLKEMPGFSFPKSKTWQTMFPNEAVRDDLAFVIDQVFEPYWKGGIGDSVVRALHRIADPWKNAATSANLRFATRNWTSATANNVTDLGLAAVNPKTMRDATSVAMAGLGREKDLGRMVDLGNGQQMTVGEIHEFLRNTGTFQTKARAESWLDSMPLPEGHEPAATRSVAGKVSRAWHKGARPVLDRGLGATVGGALGGAIAGDVGVAVGAGLGAAAGNPFSRNFALTKHVTGPLAEFTEYQARAASFIAEMRAGATPLEAAFRTGKRHVNYQSFSPAFEKYGTLLYPFAKWEVGRMGPELTSQFASPGRAQLPERFFKSWESTVPPHEREQFEREPQTKLSMESGARLVSWPKVGVPKEPEVGVAKGPGRLPHVVYDPSSRTMLNDLGAPFRVAASGDAPIQAVREAGSGMIPFFKVVPELALGMNLATGEDLGVEKMKPAPRLVASLEKKSPWLAEGLFQAEPDTQPPGTVIPYTATPEWVNQLFRYYPNVSSMDLLAGLAGEKKPYDNPLALVSRLLGLTQVPHDPAIPAEQVTRQLADEAVKYQRDAQSGMKSKAAREADAKKKGKK